MIAVGDAEHWSYKRKNEGSGGEHWVRMVLDFLIVHQ